MLDEIKTTFNFLLTDFGFTIIELEKLDRSKYIGEYLITYRNDQSKLQLEISASEIWFHYVFRRLLNGHPADYSDKENCRGFYELAILESNNNYEPMDYYAGGSKGLKKVLKRTAKLFQRNKLFFTTDIWLNTKPIKQLREEEYQIKYGFNLSDYQNKPSYFSELKREVIKFLLANSYDLISDSERFSPFERKDLLESITFSDGNKKIKIIQQDWRDQYYKYNIELNDKVIFTMNTTEYQDVYEAVLQTMEKLKQSLLLLFFMISLMSCDDRVGVQFLIQNESTQKIDSVKISTGDKKSFIVFRNIQVGENRKNFLDMRGIIKVDGHYIIQLYSNRGFKSRGFGYYTNGYPLNTGFDIFVADDTIVIKE